MRGADTARAVARGTERLGPAARRAGVVAAALAAGLVACAAPAPKRGWDDIGIARDAGAGAPVPGDLPVDPAVPPATSAGYPPPPGGRLLATFDGPAAAAPGADLLLPAGLVRPYLPEGVAGGDDLPAAGLLDLDVDGDGSREQVILARVDGPVAAAVLIALRPDGTVAAGWGLASLRDGARSCHGEWTLTGSLAAGRARLPVVHEERGVGCGAFEGGGFDRRLLVFQPGRPSPLVALLGQARLGAGGAADIHDAVAYAADRDGDGTEELWVRGLSRGVRPCSGSAGSAYRTSERAWRVISPTGTVAIRGRETLPLADGVLPANLLETQPAPCGAEGTR